MPILGQTPRIGSMSLVSFGFILRSPLFNIQPSGRRSPCLFFSKPGKREISRDLFQSPLGVYRLPEGGSALEVGTK